MLPCARASAFRPAGLDDGRERSLVVVAPGLFFIVAEVLGYLLAIELRDRYPQQLCFITVFCAITALDELNSRLRRRGAVIPRHPPGA
jgi:hypothetical protein